MTAWFLCGLSLVLLAMGARPPGGDQSSLSPSSGRIVGTVTDARTGRPLPFAAVDLEWPDSAYAVRESSADADGHFEIVDVRPGRYLVGAAQAGFVRAFTSEPVSVTPAVESPAVHLALSPAGHVRGRVLDEYGEPLAEVRVELRPASRRTGHDSSWMSPQVSASTDADGRFQLTAEPGEYTLSLDAETTSASSIRLGRSTGPQVVSLSRSASNTADDLQLLRILVLSDRTIDVPDLRKVFQPTVVVSGSVGSSEVFEDGGLQVRLRPKTDRSDVRVPEVDIWSGPGFRADGVLPGEYVLSATGTKTRTAAGLARSTEVFWGSIDMAVADRDLEGLVVPISTGSRMTGRIEVRSGKSDPGQPGTLRVTLVPEPDLTHDGGRPEVWGAVKADGSFEVGGVFPGAYRISVWMPGSTVINVLSVRRGDTESAGSHVIVDGADPRDVVIAIEIPRVP